MKILFALLLMSLSIQAYSFGEDGHSYVGSNDGAACNVYYSSAREHVSMGGIGMDGRNKTVQGNTKILEGGADFVDARVTLTFNSKNELTAAKLETKNLLFPFYLTKLVCTNLVMTK